MAPRVLPAKTALMGRLALPVLRDHQDKMVLTVLTVKMERKARQAKLPI